MGKFVTLISGATHETVLFALDRAPRRSNGIIAIASLPPAKTTRRRRFMEPAPNVLSIHFGLPSFNTDLGGGIRLPMSIVGSYGDTVPASPRIVLTSRNTAVVRIDSGTFLQSTGMGVTWVVASLDTAGQSILDSLNVTVSCTEELIVIHTPPADTIAVEWKCSHQRSRSKECGGQLTYSDTITCDRERRPRWHSCQLGHRTHYRAQAGLRNRLLTGATSYGNVIQRCRCNGDAVRCLAVALSLVPRARD